VSDVCISWRSWLLMKGKTFHMPVTVRAFSAERRFQDDLHTKIDLTTKVSLASSAKVLLNSLFFFCFQMWYTFWLTNRWLLLNFDALGSLAVLVTSLFAISGLVRAGLAAVCVRLLSDRVRLVLDSDDGIFCVWQITSAMAFTTSVYWACRFWTSLELDLK